ncbi:AmpC Beta-lactamase class C and other penicillin binding proteins [Candidatus Nanopelagicaceae bacterium]
MSTLLKVARNTVIVFVALYLALFGLTRVIHYPEPIAAIKLGIAPASKTPDLMPSHAIVAAPSTFAPWQKGAAETIGEVTYRDEKVSFQKFLDTTHTNAFLVIRDGKITHEYYKDQAFAKTRLPSYSVGKAMTSLVVGQLIDQGKISESDTFVKYFPEYKTGGSFDKITVQQLLDMQSGVGVSDNYPSGPSGWGVAIAQMYASTDIPWFLKHNRKMDFEPGRESIYRSVDPQMMGMIIQKVTGQSVSDYFTANIWQKVGADFDATWNVDRVGGYEKTFCCFNAVARDYARIGQLVLDKGVVPETKQQVISSSWMKRITSPVTRLDYQWGYGAYFWHPYQGVSLMLGLHGQFVYIDIPNNTVIVKLSDEPTDTDNLSPFVAAVLKQVSEKN